MASWKKVVLRGDNATDEQLTLTEATVDVGSDSIAFVDGDGFIKKDTIVDFTAGIAGTNISATSGQLSVGTATSTALGVVKLGSDDNQTIGANAVTETSARTYAIQLNASDQMVVNVPWVDTELSQAEVEDIVGAMLDGTETGISVSYDAVDNNIDFVVDDQTLVASSSGSNVVLTMSNPGADDAVTITAGTGISFTNVTAAGFEVAATTSAGTVTVADATSTDADHYIVFTSSTLGGDAELKGDTNFKWNPVDDTLTVTNLIVSGTTTTIDTTNLNVQDKLIKLADVATPNTTTANGAGIQVEASGTEAEWPELKWSSSGNLSGWTLADYNASSNTDYPVALMEFGTATPTVTPEAGDGLFFADTANNNLYIYV